jgi:putative MATE family efflux protein
MKAASTFTEGKILGPLMKFAVPVILALILQSLYGAVDLLVVGQFSTSADVSAVSTGSQIMQTITNIIAGLSMGTTILLGQQIGEGRSEDAGKTTGASVVFFAIAAVVFSAVMLLNIEKIATIMNAPAEAYKSTCDYLRICSWGLIFITAYNLLGSLFRGLGNSRLPLFSVAVAAVINIFGDLFCVCVLHMGAAGAALATVASQAVSVVISLFIIMKMDLPFEFGWKDIRFDGRIIQKVFGFGSPLALSELLVGVSFLIIVSIVNTLGVIASAGVGVAEKVCAFIMLVPSAFGQSMAAFTAQNYGARKMDRAHKGLLYGILVSLTVGTVMAWLSFFHGDVLCGIFSKDPEVIAAGWQYLRAYSIDCFLTSVFFVWNGYYNGCGETRFVMVQSVLGAFGVRVPVSYFMAKVRPVSIFKIGLATPASSLLQVILCIVFMGTIMKKKEEKLLEEDLPSSKI